MHQSSGAPPLLLEESCHREENQWSFITQKPRDGGLEEERSSRATKAPELMTAAVSRSVFL